MCWRASSRCSAGLAPRSVGEETIEGRCGHGSWIGCLSSALQWANPTATVQQQPREGKGRALGLQQFRPREEASSPLDRTPGLSPALKAPAAPTARGLALQVCGGPAPSGCPLLCLTRPGVGRPPVTCGRDTKAHFLPGLLGPDPESPEEQVWNAADVLGGCQRPPSSARDSALCQAPVGLQTLSPPSALPQAGNTPLLGSAACLHTLLTRPWPALPALPPCPRQA